MASLPRESALFFPSVLKFLPLLTFFLFWYILNFSKYKYPP